MQLSAKIHEARTSLSRRRTERRAHRQLTEELAAFSTAADRAQLDHLLDQHSPEETREIRTILVRRDTARQYI